MCHQNGKPIGTLVIGLRASMPKFRLELLDPDRRTRIPILEHLRDIINGLPELHRIVGEKYPRLYVRRFGVLSFNLFLTTRPVCSVYRYNGTLDYLAL